MCDCYKVGGPWVAEDPDCPVHGREAQMRQEWQEEKEQEMEGRIQRLERQIVGLHQRIKALEGG